MAIVTVVETITANAQDVFKVLGDFGSIKVGVLSPLLNWRVTALVQ